MPRTALKVKSTPDPVYVSDISVHKRRRGAPRPEEHEKMWNFQLCNSFPPEWKPVDKKTGKPLSPPYPKYRTIPNAGNAYDENYLDDKGKPSPRVREWRYIEGQPSIWADEQPGLDNYDVKQVQEMLGRDENQLTFYFGQLNVRGIQQLRMDALRCQDGYEGKKVQYQQKPRVYRLENPDNIVREEMTLLEKEWQAEKLARECTVDQMLECCFIMGMDISDQSDSSLRRLKLEFLKKAKYDSKNPDSIEWFTGIVNNPLTHIKYVVGQALVENLISTTQQPGRLTWAMANTPIFDIDAGRNPTDYICGLYFTEDEQAMKLVEELERMLSAE